MTHRYFDQASTYLLGTSMFCFVGGFSFPGKKVGGRGGFCDPLMISAFEVGHTMFGYSVTYKAYLFICAIAIKAIKI